MRKIINGKQYDTSKAILIGEWDNGLGKSDHKCIYETLYQKRTGEFFLHGEGGGMTPYREIYGNLSGWGEKILPIPVDVAKQWVEEHLTAEEYEKIFDVVEDEDDEDDDIIRKDLHLTLPATTVDKLKKKAVEKGISVSSLINELVKDMQV